MIAPKKFLLQLKRTGLTTMLPWLTIFLLGTFASSAVSLLAGSQEQGAEKDRPAYEVYKNLDLLKDDRVSVARLDRIMRNLNKYLGVECVHCHEQDNWAKDDLSEEQVHAREMVPKMWKMVGNINLGLFNPEGLDGPACWTCHRGSTEPGKFPAQRVVVKVPEPRPFVNSQEPSEKVYKNIQQLKKLPARNLRSVMNMMSVALGVECSHCHVEGDYASDEKKTKQVARKMFGFRSAIIKEHFKGRVDAIFCWTCHRGATKPEIRPANWEGPQSRGGKK